MIRLQQFSDKAAIGLSALCVIHCLFLPITLILFPSLAGLLSLNSEAFHLWLVFAVIPISLLALYIGYSHHRNFSVFAVASVGLMILAAALLGHEHIGAYGEVVLTVIGSSVIAYGHYRNYLLGRERRCITPL